MFPPHLQDSILNIINTVGIGYALLFLILLWNLYPIFAFVPLAVIALGVYILTYGSNAEFGEGAILSKSMVIPKAEKGRTSSEEEELEIVSTYPRLPDFMFE